MTSRGALMVRAVVSLSQLIIGLLVLVSGLVLFFMPSGP